MPATATVIELEPLALPPAEAACYLSISKRSLSRLIVLPIPGNKGKEAVAKRAERPAPRQKNAG
jgi:hypothetical protein